MFTPYLNTYITIVKYTIFLRFTPKTHFSTIAEQDALSLSKKGDRYDSNANDYISWDPTTPVLIRMENTAPGNYPPILVQTFLRQVIHKNGNKIAMKYKENDKVKELTYLVSKYELLRVGPC